eukprot:8694-Pelagococcus_subviridis.AAC.7
MIHRVERVRPQVRGLPPQCAACCPVPHATSKITPLFSSPRYRVSTAAIGSLFRSAAADDATLLKFPKSFGTDPGGAGASFGRSPGASRPNVALIGFVGFGRGIMMRRPGRGSKTRRSANIE